MERNENGVPVKPNGSGGNAIENFFEEQGCLENNGTEGCRKTENGNTGTDLSCDSMPLAYAYVPWQKWRQLYSPVDALKNGTLFEELNKPLGVYGNE